MGSLGASLSANTFPGTKTLPSFWRSQPHLLDTHRSTPEIPQSCDVIIIGAGYAGVSTAYHLLCNEELTSQSPPLSVLMLEAREACSGATARNGGHLRPSIFGRLPGYLEKYGSDFVLELIDFECGHISDITLAVEKEKIDCDFTPTTSLNVYVDQDAAAAAKNAFLHLKEIAGSRAAIRNTRWIEGEEAEKVSSVKGAVGCFQFPAIHLWPYKLVMALLQRAVESGLNLQTHTPVQHVVSSQTDPGKWTVHTIRGAITAGKVIFATNGYTAGLLPEYKTKIVPSKGICCRIKFSPKTPHVPLQNSYCIWLRNGSCDYLIPRHDNSIIVGGARSEFFHEKHNWYNRTDDNSLIYPARNYFNDYMQTNFCGWEKSDAHVDSIWTGIMGYNSDSLPNIGAVPNRPGCFIEAGFQGNGMPIIWPVSRGIAEMVLKGKSYEELGLPLLYQTSKERLQSPTDHMLGRL
ncbi:Gamma-glutamylputrescine oxidoreductase [Golovinomyces cichoracearum]|uniref:Gamma-glutamylputrescine oxidoreductase n=1 Tax=Golovinomyces cichoracearum TaxID=62708 RepID=A0A420HGU8_9PEZI|nr:Gamma-glutamylputrescine oxidoreductase [Golovinomyces cichoracearum]